MTTAEPATTDQTHDEVGFIPEHEVAVGFVRETPPAARATITSPNQPPSLPEPPEWFLKMSPTEQAQYGEDSRAMLPENPAVTLSRFGKAAVGGLADIGTTSQRDPQEGQFANARAGFNLEKMPIQSTMETPGMPAGITFPYKVGSSMVETAPKLAAVIASGPGAPLTAAALFGYDDTGEFHPVQSVVAASLPIIGKYGGTLAESLAARLGVSSEAALSWIKAAGAYAAANALLAGQSAVEISKLPPEQRKQAIVDSAANMLGQGLLGLTEFHGANAEGKAFQARSEQLANLKALLNSSPEVIPGAEKLMIPPAGEKANVSAPEAPATDSSTTPAEQRIRELETHMAAKLRETGQVSGGQFTDEAIQKLIGSDPINPLQLFTTGLIHRTPEGHYQFSDRVTALANAGDTTTDQPQPAQPSATTYPPAADQAGQSLEEGAGSTSDERAPRTLSQYTPATVAPEDLPAQGARDPKQLSELWVRAAQFADESHRHAAALPRKEDGSIDFKKATDEQVDRLFDLDTQLSDVRAEILRQFRGPKDEAPTAEEPQQPTQAKESEAPQETPKAPAQQELGFVDKIVSALEGQAGKAEQRIAGRRGRLLTGLPVDDLADYAIVGAAKLARGTVDVAKWTTSMLEQFGDKIKPHLETLYQRSRAILRQTAQNEANKQTETERIINSGEGVSARAKGVTDAMIDEGGTLIREQIRKHGKEDVRQWVAGMEKLFGPAIRPLLEETYLAARREVEMPPSQVRQRMPFSGGRGVIRVGEAEALRQVLKAAETAGAAGREAATSEFKPKIAELKQQLSESLTKAQALAAHLQGQEKGAKIGAAQKQSELAMAQKWMEAESRDIQKSLLDLLTSSLPVSERGKFTKRIIEASRPPSLLSKEPTAMQERAAKLASTIIFAGEEHQKKTLTTDIKALGEKWADSAQVDVNYRRQIRQEMARFDLLRKSGGLPLDVLQAFHDRLVSLKDIGKSEANVRRSVDDWLKEFALRELADSNTVPMEKRQMFRPRPGEKSTFSQRLGNHLRAAMNGLEYTDRALMPIDALMEVMEGGKGTYQGWLFRRFRGPVDLAFNNTLVRSAEMNAPLDKVIKEHRLNQQNSERIGVFAQVQQKGGRDRLIRAGIKPEEIDRIAKTLTTGERAAYKAMREQMEKAFPQVQELMRKLYNIDVRKEENYFPMQRDWKVIEPELPEAPEKANVTPAFDAQATYRAIARDFLPGTTEVEKGMTIERKPGALTPIKIDAFEIYRQHAQDVAHLIETQPILKAAGEMLRTDLFKAKYGAAGQILLNDWLDTISRQGGAQGAHRLKALDWLRQKSSIGVVAFRIASQFVHASNIPLSMAHVGPGWYAQGLLEVMTPKGQQFMKDNFNETIQRQGSEPAQAELRRGPVTNLGFAIAREIDKYNSQAAVLGYYQKALAKKGINPANYDTVPVDRAAQQQALVRARRAVASPLPKDLPMAISRGALFGKNISIGKSVFQFGNFGLDQFSNLRLDFAKAGIREKNYPLAIKMALALTAVVALETGIRRTFSAATSTMTGYSPKKQESFSGQMFHEALKRFPFASQLIAMAQWQETGIPAIDSVVQTAHSTYLAHYAKTEKARNKAKIKAVTGVAQILGVPGASQVGEIFNKAQ